MNGTKGNGYHRYVSDHEDLAELPELAFTTIVLLTVEDPETSEGKREREGLDTLQRQLAWLLVECECDDMVAQRCADDHARIRLGKRIATVEQALRRLRQVHL